MWGLAAEFHNKVKENWKEKCEGRHVFKVVGKLNRLRRVLKTLNKDQVQYNRKKSRNINGEIDTIPIVNSGNKDLYNEENKLAQEVRTLEKQKINSWDKKVKYNGLKKGIRIQKNFVAISSQGGVPTEFSQSHILLGCNILKSQR